MSTPIQLLPEEAAQLAAAEEAARHAQKDAEIAVLEAKLALMKAARAQSRLVQALAAKYGFDARRTWALDQATGVLTPAA